MNPGYVHVASDQIDWDYSAEILVAGASVAGLAVAVFAAEQGAKVAVFEKGDEIGGTANKASALMWVPNNRFMREQGIADPKDDAMRYMARLSRPASYDPAKPQLGLVDWEYDALEAFYDNASTAFETLEEIGALAQVHSEMVDYFSHLPEDKAGRGRGVMPRLDDGESGEGVDYVAQMNAAALARDVEVHTAHAAVGAVVDADGAVVGLRLRTADGDRWARAEKAVVFASGGYTHNLRMRDEYLGGRFFGGCDAITNEGDFVEVARALGAPLYQMDSAYMAPVPAERALAADPDMHSAFAIPGDGLIMVNKYGRRFANEKSTYHELARAHHAWGGMRAEYPNLVSFAVWDERTDRLFAGAQFGSLVIPAADGDRSYVVGGKTPAELAAALSGRLERIAADTGGLQLDGDFAANLTETIARFNGFARSGVDLDFQRGETDVEAAFNGPAVDDNNLPNATMHPLSEDGPYFATLLAAGSLGTKGGPRTTVDGEVVGADGKPIPGLFGVGNCVACPAGESYLAGGATFGPIVTFGYLAARRAVQAPRRAAAVA